MLAGLKAEKRELDEEVAFRRHTSNMLQA